MDVANSIDVVLFYLFFSYNFNVIVDRMIGASRHSKVIVDGINTSKKRCRMEGNE